MAKLGSRYAKALFGIGKDENSLDTLFNDCVAFKTTLSKEKDFKAVMNHPKLSREEKMTFTKNVFGNNLSEDFYGLVHVILSKNREAELNHILQSFIDLYNEERGLCDANVYTSQDVTEEMKDKLIEVLEKKLNKKVECKFVVDKGLIGGFRVEVDGLVFDSSIKNKLKALKTELYKASV